MEALELRAAALFRQSMELTTGVFAWTKGELLGEGAFGKVGGRSCWGTRSSLHSTEAACDMFARAVCFMCMSA